MRNNYPFVYRKALQALGKEKELKAYIQYCRNKRETSIEDYSIYVHGCLLPYFKSMRLNGKLSMGKKSIMNGKWNYQGELDSYG